MVGIDANILLRYLTRDHEELTARATHVLEERCTEEKPGYVTILALAEVYWTLRSAYDYSAEEIADAIEALLKARELRFEQEDAIWHALARARERFGFADALIGYIGTSNGCSTTLTLDKKAARMKVFSEA